LSGHTYYGQSLGGIVIMRGNCYYVGGMDKSRHGQMHEITLLEMLVNYSILAFNSGQTTRKV